MEEIIQEKISADHLLYVSLKYTKTCDVIINLLLRWRKMIDTSIWGLTSSQLNSVFRGGSAISFNTLNTNDKFTFKRDNTDSLTAVFGGTNSGTISIEYYAVPEPETWALLAFSLTTIMVLRRRRNY